MTDASLPKLDDPSKVIDFHAFSTDVPHINGECNYNEPVYSGWHGEGAFGWGWGKGWGKRSKKGGKGQSRGAHDEPLDLMTVSHALWHASLVLDNDAGLAAALLRVRTARQQFQKKNGMSVDTNSFTTAAKKKKKRPLPGISAPEAIVPSATAKATAPAPTVTKAVPEIKVPITPQDKHTQKILLLQRLVDLLRTQPDHRLEATHICQDPQIKVLRNSVFSSFQKFVTHSFPLYFEMDKPGPGPRWWVKLRDPSVTAIDMSLENRGRNMNMIP